MLETGPPFSPPHGSSFPTTNWSEIGKLGTDDCASALQALCERYWYPIYAFVRRRSSDQHEAEDLTQAFFQKVLSQQLFRAADPEKGRFRSYVLTSLRNFLTSRHAAEGTQRRGGHHRILPIDLVDAEQLCAERGSAGQTPEQEFERAWAITLLERAIDRLKQEYAAKRQAQRFQLFVPALQPSPLDYAAVAEALEIDVVAARKAASRFRRRYAQLLREEIALTLSETGDVDEEISWIISRFRS